MAAKKFLLSLLLTILLSTRFVICSPQNTSSQPWPLEVAGLQMTVGDGRSVSNTTSATNIGGNMRASGGLGGSASAGQQKISFYLKAKNPLSDKTIKQIEWECCFLNTKNETVKNSFKSKKKLKPSAKEETIEETVFFNVATVPTKVKLGFRIKKIEYEDSTVWESKSTTPDADFVFQNVEVN